jgi:hypothetical protein
MNANYAMLGYFREGNVMYPWPASSTSEAGLPAQHAARQPREHEISQEEMKQWKKISAILGYELDYDDRFRGIQYKYYSQDRWKHVSKNFLHVRPEDEVEHRHTSCPAWIFSYSTDFLTSGMNWKNDRKEILFHLRRYPAKNPADRNRLVMNSCTMTSGFSGLLSWQSRNACFPRTDGELGNWGTEEHVVFQPADVGDSIHLRQIAVFVDDDGFHVAWNGRVQYTFKHRIPWSSFQKFEVDPGFDLKITEMKGTTFLRGSGRFRVATWDGKERKFLTVNHSRVKVGNIKEFISTVLDVPELTKEEFDRWCNLRESVRGTPWNTIFLTSEKKHTLFTVAKQNCPLLLALHEERVLLELVLENSKPLLLSVVFSGAIRQYAREEHSRDHRRANSTNDLAAVLEHLACSIVHHLQRSKAVGDKMNEVLEFAKSHRMKAFIKDPDKLKAVGEEMSEALEFATTHRMKNFISEPVIVKLVNNRWSQMTVPLVDNRWSNYPLLGPIHKLIPRFLDVHNYHGYCQSFIIPFYIIVFIFWAGPLALLTSSWPPAWRFWAFQASYLTYAILAWYLPSLCTSTSPEVSTKKPLDWRNACLEYGKSDDDCCGALRNII